MGLLDKILGKKVGNRVEVSKVDTTAEKLIPQNNSSKIEPMHDNSRKAPRYFVWVRG